MPRVSDEHLEARRTQIIEAAVRCFARQGFHATSMQDVFAESGLSAGAVYRYFPSKSALVRTTSQFVLRRLSGLLDEFGDRATTTTSAAELVHVVTSRAATVTVATGVPISRLALNAWAEALRDPDVAEVVREIIAEIHARLTQIARGWQEAGRLPADADPADVAAPLYSLLVGFLVQNLVGDGLGPDDYRRGVAALSTVGAEVPRGDAQPA